AVRDMYPTYAEKYAKGILNYGAADGEGEYLARRLGDLDARNDLVACGGGKVLQIVGKQVKITDAEPGMLLTQKLGAAPDTDTEKMDYWKGLIQDWTGCKESAECLQSVIGLSMFGRATRHKIVLFMEGQTNTGKTTFAEVIKAAFADYGIAADETFSRYNNREKHLRQGSLHGKRLALIPDLGPGQKLDASMLKTVSGGDSLTGRKLNRDTFDFQPQCLILGAANDLPAPDTMDAAIKDRWKVIPFERQFTKDQDMIEGLKTRLKDEYLGVVVEWAREGMERVLQEGNRFTWSSGIVARSSEYWQRTDPFDAWLSTCEVDKGNRGLFATTKELFESYNAYRESESLKPVKSQGSFGRKLHDHGFPTGRIRVPGSQNPTTRRIGICLSVDHCRPLDYSKTPTFPGKLQGQLQINGGSADSEPVYSGLQTQECENCGGLIKYGDGVQVDGQLLCDPDCTGNPF
ncbi:MAG: phage/plasmid primase, P4 family, partial [Gemmatimonadota bacterium]|nr:phage/plasmid primase, P4 family [Gemmatimonadota bacterium]